LVRGGEKAAAIGPPQARPPTQPAKTTLFAGGKAPRLRRNFLRLIN
jgi:hypothetical protein